MHHSIRRVRRSCPPAATALLLACGCFVLLAGIAPAAEEEKQTYTSRAQIPEKYKWDLADLYETDELWEKDFQEVQQSLPKFKEYEGKLGDSAEILLAALKLDTGLNIRLDRLQLYVMLAKDRDLGVAKYQGMSDRATNLASEFAAATAYFRPELLTIPLERLEKFMQENAELRVYRHYFDDLLRTKAHTLPKAQEELLAMSMPQARVPYTTFSVLNNADLKFPVVQGPEGGEVQITSGKYYAAMFSTDRAYRERVYKGYYEPYLAFDNTLGALLGGSIKAAVFDARARKYTSTLAAALDGPNVPPRVYANLVEIVNEDLDTLHRWCGLKRRVLGLKEMHPYDAYVTLFPAKERRYTYEEAKQLVLEALEPLGEDYHKTLSTAFDQRWVDVYETPGKRSGAYSSGPSYDVHPYVLMNWNGTLDNVFTLAHEMGHCLHSYYSAKNQPYVYSDYSTFVAEVASITNEALLRDYLIEHAETKQQQMAMIEQELFAITVTFFRQTRFAEFERQIHEMAGAGAALTPDRMTELFGKTYQKYWGPEMTADPQEGHSWARIPHFYYNFYVYQYATSFAASQSLAGQIKQQGQPAVDRYLGFLKSGSSEYPIEILKKAGVDMAAPGPVLAVIRRGNVLLDRLETLLKKE